MPFFYQPPVFSNPRNSRGVLDALLTQEEDFGIPDFPEIPDFSGPQPFFEDALGGVGDVFDAGAEIVDSVIPEIPGQDPVNAYLQFLNTLPEQQYVDAARALEVGADRLLPALINETLFRDGEDGELVNRFRTLEELIGLNYIEPEELAALYPDLYGDGGQPAPVPDDRGSGGQDIGDIRFDTGGIDAFQESLRLQESSNNYDAIGVPTRYGRATGAYQFIDSTWQSQAPPEIASRYPRAVDAPPEIQDQVARDYMLRLFSEYGDWRLVAAAWHGGPGAANRIRDTGSTNSEGPLIRTEDYADQVIARLG